MKEYLELLKKVRTEGELSKDRTGVGTYSLFGEQLSIDLKKGFPLLTTKKVHWKSVVYELLWFLRGDSHVKYLRDNGITIWDEWTNTNGDLGRIYGKQWCDWRSPGKTPINQIRNVVEQIKLQPDSRRLIVTAWNPGELVDMALPPCHCMFQFYVRGGRLSCKLYQRSADIFLGVPFNIASYALLTCMIATVCDLTPDRFIHTFGDLHLYKNHVNQADEQLTRIPKELPNLSILHRGQTIQEFKFEDFELQNYLPEPAIKAPVAV